MLLYLHDFNGVLRKNKNYYLYLIKLGKLTSLSSISMRSLKLNFLVITEGRYICILLMQKCAVCVEKRLQLHSLLFLLTNFLYTTFTFPYTYYTLRHTNLKPNNCLIKLLCFSALKENRPWYLRFHNLKVQISFIDVE